MEGRPTSVYFYEMISLAAFMMWRILVIAIKYSYLLTSPYWSEKLLKECLKTEEILSLDVVAWLTPTPEIVHREIGIASERIGERPETRYFAHAADAASILKVRDIGPTDDATFVDRLVTRPNEVQHLRTDSSLFDISPRLSPASKGLLPCLQPLHSTLCPAPSLKASTLPIPGSFHIPIVLLFCLIPYTFRLMDGIYMVSKFDTIILVTAFIPTCKLTSINI